MKRTRKALIALWAAAVLLVLAVHPAAAQSSSAELIGELNDKLLVVALPITLLVEGILIYAVLKFRNNDDPKPTRENRRLEITWTIATAIVLLFVGFAAFEVMADPAVSTVDQDPPEDAMVIDVEGNNQWQWQFNYTGEYEGVQTTDEVYLPEGQEVYFNVTAEDWLHMMHVPELGIKQQARPETGVMVSTTPTETGTYQGYCTEYCGVGHSGMLFEVHVESPDDFEESMQEQLQEAEGDGGDESSGNESAE